MDLESLQKNWDQFGRTDPLWAILTWPDRKGNRWELEEFFATGRVFIEMVLNQLGAPGLRIPRRRALDFGCGVGRLSQALACHFDEVYGVDIAPSMIELANRYNRHGSTCRYILNANDDLRFLASDSVDFVSAIVTLQHMEFRYARKYLGEFLRVLAPGGILVFNLPGPQLRAPHSRSSPLRNLLRRWAPEIIRRTYRRIRNRPGQGCQWGRAAFSRIPHS